MSYPEAVPASPEYAYVDPKTAHYALAHLPEQYHPLDVWKTFGKQPDKSIVPFTLIVVTGGISFGLIAFTQGMLGKPIYSQIYKHITGTIATSAFFIWGWKKRRENQSRRDAIIQDYIEANYDDFPLIQRRKFKDEFRIWHPNR